MVASATLTPSARRRRHTSPVREAVVFRLQDDAFSKRAYPAGSRESRSARQMPRYRRNCARTNCRKSIDRQHLRLDAIPKFCRRERFLRTTLERSALTLGRLRIATDVRSRASALRHVRSKSIAVPALALAPHAMWTECTQARTEREFAPALGKNYITALCTLRGPRSACLCRAVQCCGFVWHRLD